MNSAPLIPEPLKLHRHPSEGRTVGAAISLYPPAAADVHADAVAARHLGIDPAQHKYLAVERDDLAVTGVGGRPFRADVILAAGAALESEFLALRLIGQKHDHA